MLTACWSRRARPPAARGIWSRAPEFPSFPLLFPCPVLTVTLPSWIQFTFPMRRPGGGAWFPGVVGSVRAGPDARVRSSSNWTGQEPGVCDQSLSAEWRGLVGDGRQGPLAAGRRQKGSWMCREGEGRSDPRVPLWPVASRALGPTARRGRGCSLGLSGSAWPPLSARTTGLLGARPSTLSAAFPCDWHSLPSVTLDFSPADCSLFYFGGSSLSSGLCLVLFSLRIVALLTSAAGPVFQKQLRVGHLSRPRPASFLSLSLSSF